VKLLFDQNLSPRLVALHAELFPGTVHVREVGLARAMDEVVWRFALDRGFAIVTIDSDFQERSQLAGSAPKIIWIRHGNCSTRDIEAMLRAQAPRIAALEHVGEFRPLIYRRQAALCRKARDLF
jgi:predicted nuclease of predicted toxin-antitoxin system